MIRSALRDWLAGSAIVGSIVAFAVVAITSSASATLHSSQGKPHLSERQVLGIALKVAAQAGDRKPTLIQHAERTRHEANLVASGDLVPGRRWSYLIAERGHFVFKNASRPAGARAPSGSVLTLVVDASTRQVTDTGLSNRYPHLSDLGPVRTDLRRQAQSAAEASCVGLNRQQQRAAAKVIVIGRMLSGRSTMVGKREVLLSPARMRASRYVKGAGPQTVKVQTGVRLSRGQIQTEEDGIMPSAGQRWEILSSSRQMPLRTSICIGSGQLAPTRGSSSRVGPVSHRLFRFLNSNGPMAFRLAGSGARPKIKRPAAIQDALRDALWRPASAKGISLVRFEHGTAKIPVGTLAWLVSVKPRKPIYDGSKTSRGPAGNYFVVVVRARDGRFLGAADGYSPALANRSGGGGWGTAELA
jgi:hypothetical protein